MATRYLAKGTLLKMGDGAGPEVFTSVVQLTKIGGISVSRNTQESSDHDTTGGKTFLAEKLYDGGEVPFEGHFDPATATQSAATGIIKAFIDATLVNWKLVFPDSGTTTWPFSAFVTKVGPSEMSHDGKLMFSGTLKISGSVTFA